MPGRLEGSDHDGRPRLSQSSTYVLLIAHLPCHPTAASSSLRKAIEEFRKIIYVRNDLDTRYRLFGPGGYSTGIGDLEVRILWTPVFPPACTVQYSTVRTP